MTSMDSQEIMLVTGANRGIGLGLVREALSKGYRVLAGCRDPEGDSATELRELAKENGEVLTVVKLDVASDASVEAAFERCADLERVDVVFNNAGIFPGERDDRLETVEPDQLLQAFDTNVAGSFRVARAFLPLLRESKRPRVIQISSGVGGLTHRDSMPFPAYAYSISKTAVNMLTRVMAMDLREDAVCVVSMSPGWVKTEMGGENAQITVEESAKSLVAAAESLSMKDSGRWLDRHGKPVDAW